MIDTILVCRSCGHAPERSVRSNAAGTAHHIACTECDRLITGPTADSALARWNGGEQLARPCGPAVYQHSMQRRVKRLETATWATPQAAPPPPPKPPRRKAAPAAAEPDDDERRRVRELLDLVRQSAAKRKQGKTP